MRGHPNIPGAFGNAWLCQPPKQGPKDWTANVRQYQVNRPGAHPFWSWWVVSCSSLRDIPGVAPAKKHYPEAEHEFVIIALNPDQPVPDPDEQANGRRYQFLTPIDVVHQFNGLDDAQCGELVDLAVRMIVERGMSPDQDYRHLWKELIANTVEHLATGGHPKSKA